MAKQMNDAWLNQRLHPCGSDVRLIGRQGDNVYLVEVEPING